MVSEDRLLDFVTRLPNFSIRDQMSIEVLLWTTSYRNENDIEPDYMIEFTTDEYDSTIHEMMKNVQPTTTTMTTPMGMTTPCASTTLFTIATPTMNTTISQNGTENPNTKASIKDYPKFNGSLDHFFSLVKKSVSDCQPLAPAVASTGDRMPPAFTHSYTAHL